MLGMMVMLMMLLMIMMLMMIIMILRLEHSLPRSYTCPPLTKNDDDEGGGDCDEHFEYTIPGIILQY